MRFDGSPVAGRHKSAFGFSCRGRKAVRMRGNFHGTIRFAGENGFTAVDAKRVRGGFYRSFRRSAASRRANTTSSRSQAIPNHANLTSRATPFTVESKAGNASTELLISATKFRLGQSKDESFAVAFIVAGSNERVGAVSISRNVFTVNENAPLRVSRPGVFPIEATVKLPKPFTGEASYREDQGQPPS